jgi:hypothetical protein
MLLESKEIFMSLLHKALAWDRYIRQILDSFFAHFQADPDHQHLSSSSEIMTVSSLTTSSTAFTTTKKKNHQMISNKDQESVHTRFLKYKIMHPLRIVIEKFSDKIFLESEMIIHGIKLTGQELISIILLSIFLCILLIIRRRIANLVHGQQP